MAKVVAFEYDNSTTGAEAPVTFGAVPGVWTPGEPVLPEAFGMTVEQMRDSIKEFSLPIREVRVEEKDAVAELDRGLNHLPVEESTLMDPAKPSHATVATKEGPISAAVTGGTHRLLLPGAAAEQAKNTVLSNGGTLEEAAAAAREAGGAWGERAAEAAESAAEDHRRAAERQQADRVAEPEAAADGPGEVE